MDERTNRLVEAAVVATSKHLIKRWQRIVSLMPDRLESTDTSAHALNLCIGFSQAAQVLEDQACVTSADLRTAGGLMVRKIENRDPHQRVMYAAILKHCADECRHLASSIEQEAKLAEFQNFEKPENHTPECFARYEREVQRVRESALDALAYLVRWPGVCRVCNGAGGFSRYDYDSGYDFDPCSCAEAGRCPRCGDVFLQEGDREEQCPVCGWNAQDPDTLPDYDGGPECYGECKGEPIFW